MKSLVVILDYFENLSLLLILFTANSLAAQTPATISLTFSPTFENTPLVLEDTFYKHSESDSLQIEVLRFYISQVEFYDGLELVHAEAESFHLLDAAIPSSLILNPATPSDLSFSQIRFNIGIDSLTNVSGAFGGDLDPTKGMYWTWQSGYINFKLEGIASNCSARKNRFQFHIGGYQAPFRTLQNISLAASQHKKDIRINIALDQLFHQINLAETNQVMSPNQEALTFAHLLPSIFSIEK